MSRGAEDRPLAIYPSWRGQNFCGQWSTKSYLHSAATW